MQQHRAYMTITYQGLIDLLDLPEGTQIVGVESEVEDILLQRVNIYVEHPGLPPTPEGGVPIRVSPGYTRETIVLEAKFKEWGI